MGLFDFFSRKAKPPATEAETKDPEPPRPPAAEPPPDLSPWQQQVWRAERAPGFEWSDDNGPARALARSLLFHAREAFGDAKLTTGEPPEVASPASVLINRFGRGAVSSSTRLPELHGTWEGSPVRIPVAMGAKKVWAIEMRCEERARFFTVIRDPSRVPPVGTSDDPWARGAPACVFLGPGVYLDDDDLRVMEDWMLPAWMSLPPGTKKRVVLEMERLDLRCLVVSNGHRGILALGNRTLPQLSEPKAFLEDVARLMAEVARGLAETTGAIPTAAAGTTSAKCKYCSSIFILASGENRCPNCGAPAS